MKRTRLALGVVMHCHQWYSGMYVLVSLGGLLTKPQTERWILTFMSVVGYPVIQYWRGEAGMRLARGFTEGRCSLTSLLSVPVFLVQMLLFSHQETLLVVDRAAGIIAFVLSFLESILIGSLLARNRSWTACTPISLLHLLVFAGSFSTLLVSVIL